MCEVANGNCKRHAVNVEKTMVRVAVCVLRTRKAIAGSNGKQVGGCVVENNESIIQRNDEQNRTNTEARPRNVKTHGRANVENNERRGSVCNARLCRANEAGVRKEA